VYVKTGRDQSILGNFGQVVIDWSA